MGIETWRDRGVDLRVWLSTSGDLVRPSVEKSIPLTSGGANGLPAGAGWTQYLYNASAQQPNNWAQSTSSGVYKVGCATPGYNNIDVGAYYREPIQAGKLYQVRVKTRLQDSHNDTTYSLYIQARDPIKGDYYYLDGIFDWTASSELVLAAATADQEPPARFSQIELIMQARPVNINLGTTFNWGVQFQELQLVTFDVATSTITWRDITCDVKQLGWRYGRERFTNRYDVANINLQLANDDGAYSYANPHPFNLEPGRLVKVEATLDGVMYPQAFAVVDQLTDGVALDGTAITNMQCLDPTSIFSNRPTPQITGTNDADTRINEIAKFMGYPNVAIDNGVWTMQEIASSGRSLRDEMGITADSEGGSVFADREGRITYKNRNWLTTDPNLMQVTANLWAKPDSQQPYFDGTPTQPGAPAICLNRLVTDWGMSRVINYVELANAGGTVYYYNAFPSQKRYGPRSYTRHDFVLELVGEGHLADRANDIMTGYDTPKLRLNSVSYRPGVDGNDWKYTLRVFLNWLVRVWYQNLKTGWGWLIVTHVQSVEHRVTPTDWEVTMSLDQPTYYADAPVQAVLAWDDPRAKWDTTGVWL